MYPDLSYFFHDLLGTARDNWLSIFKTFGLLLVIAILTAAWLLKKELVRRAQVGQLPPVRVKVAVNKPFTTMEYVYNALFGFVVGYKLVYAFQNAEALQQDAGAVILSLAGSWWGGLLGAALFSLYYYVLDRKRRESPAKVENKEVYPHDRIGDITVVAAISGVVGAKVFALIEDLPAFFADPIGTFFSGSGLAIYGGLVGGFVGVWLYLRSKNIPLVPIMDAVAPALIVAYGVGRLGCHFAGDGDWGIVAAAQPGWWFLPDWLWAYDYPHNVLNEGQPLAGCEGHYCYHLVPPVYPTSLYETMAAFSIGGILWALRKPLTWLPGLLFCVYLILNGIERFAIEKIRVNERYDYFGLHFTQAEFIAILFILIGLAWGGFILSRKRRAAV